LLYIEKEGFLPLFDAVHLVRHDLAILSNKGMSVTASRELADTLCALYDIPLLVFHDFDKAGFSIFGTLQKNTRRYSFRNPIKIIDMSMRLAERGSLYQRL
jgi:hypothetical protein